MYKGILEATLISTDNDELKQVNEKIESTSKNIEKRLKNIETSIVQYHNIEDTFIKTVANGFIEKDK